jgi:hypothetical protein
MIHPDTLNAALLAYLGGEPNSGGITPLGGEERLRAAFPDDARVKAAVETVLTALGSDRKSVRLADLAAMAASARARMKTLRPELSDVVAAKLGNFYAYSRK